MEVLPMSRKDYSKSKELIVKYGIKHFSNVHEFLKMLTAKPIQESHQIKTHGCIIHQMLATSQ